MDEPLSGLDAKLNVRVRREILRLHKELGFGLLYVTHDREEALEIVTRVITMKEGSRRPPPSLTRKEEQPAGPDSPRTILPGRFPPESEEPVEEPLRSLRLPELRRLRHREAGEAVDHGSGEEPPASPATLSPGVVDRDPRQTAARRAALEDETADPPNRRLIHCPGRPTPQPIGPVQARFDLHQPGRPGITGKAHRPPRDGKPHPDLRAEGNPFHEGHQSLDHPPVPLVLPIVADLLTEEAGADPDPGECP